MAYYRLLLAIMVVLVVSVFVQGQNLFKDEFFLIAYVIMALVLFIGTKRRKTPNVVLGIGMIMIFSMGALSTWALIEMFASPGIPVLKLAIVLSMDLCAILFLHEARRMRRDEPGGSREEGMFWKPH